MPVRIAAFIIFAYSLIPAVQADVMEMPAESNAGQIIEMPVKGMSMSAVEQHYGTPVEKKSAVGEPPITRWLYDTFTVYFEHQYVIHSVIDP